MVVVVLRSMTIMIMIVIISRRRRRRRSVGPSSTSHVPRQVRTTYPYGFGMEDWLLVLYIRCHEPLGPHVRHSVSHDIQCNLWMLLFVGVFIEVFSR
jgi:hypothetical protein